MSKALKYVAFPGIALLTGAVFGYVWSGKAVGESSAIVTQMYALGEYETLTTLQYQESSPARGREALLDLLDFMDRVESSQGNAIGNSLNIDRAITYTRLAMLEERGGDKEKSQEYIQRAQSCMMKRGETLTEARLREIVAKQDSRIRYALPTIFVLRQAKR